MSNMLRAVNRFVEAGRSRRCNGFVSHLLSLFHYVFFFFALFVFCSWCECVNEAVMRKACVVRSSIFSQMR